ncbi:MAG: serine/threonine protein kinase, partial [Crocosphaera sp.]
HKSSTGIFSMGFAPPEQMQGSTVYPATDLYALGTTCLNLLTGKAPEELYDSYNNCWNWKPHVTNISDGLANVLDRLLLPSPSDRYQSAAEVLQALHSSQSQSILSSPKTSIQTPLNQPISSPSSSSSSVAYSSTSNQPIPSPTPSSSPVASSTAKSSFSSVDLLLCSGFTGFEGALLILILQNLIAAPGIIIGFMFIGGLIYVQYRRIIEGKDLLIIAGLSVLLMLIPILRVGLPFQYLIIVAVGSGSSLIAVTALFRLIYQSLSRVL